MTEPTVERSLWTGDRTTVREYRKTTTVLAGQATEPGIIPTLEGDHSYEAGDYICGPGQAGEFWPVKRSIFEATYALVEVGSESSPEPHKPGEFHRYRAECEVCGQPGQVRVTLVPEQAEEPS